MKVPVLKTLTVRTLLTVVLLTAPVMMLWAQEANKKYALTTQMFLNELKEKAKQPADAQRPSKVRRHPDGRPMPKAQRLIASPDTVGGVAYISCFIHLKDASDLSAVRALGVKVEETFDGLDFITARVPVSRLEALADIDNVTKIKVAQQMRPLTDKAREVTNVDDLLTQSPDALALGVNSKYDGTGVILGVIDTGIDFQHIAFKDKNGNSRIKRAYIYTNSGTDYTESDISSATTDDEYEDHGTHTSTTAGGSSVIVSGNNVTVTDDHANATYGGMAPGADLYLAGVQGLQDTGLTNALYKMVTYADEQNKPLVVSNSWGSSIGPRDGTGELADLVDQYFGDNHPNRVILFAASNDAGHCDEGTGGFFIKKSNVTPTDPLATIIRTNDEGGDYYGGVIASAYLDRLPKCCIYVYNNEGVYQYDKVVTQTKTFGLGSYYDGQLKVEIAQDNGKYVVVVSSDDGLLSKDDGKYTLAIKVYSDSGSTDVNMWAGDWTFFTDQPAIQGGPHWIAGTDDMCVSDEATIPNAISIGAYVSKKNWKSAGGNSYTADVYTVGDIAYFSSYATAEQSPTGLAYPWISAPGARLAAGVNHNHTASVDYSYSYYGKYSSDLVVNSSSNPYAMMEGTSMATPVAAGIVALWLQASMEKNAVHKNLTVNDVKDIMQQTAVTDSYTTTGANASHFGHGKIDALAGIQYILGSTGGPVITATPKSIDFGSVKYDNGTYTKTLNVRGFNLEDDVTVTLADANGVYSLSQTSITQSAAAGGVDITITFAPQAEGTYNGTITLTSAGADDVVVNLTGTATDIEVLLYEGVSGYSEKTDSNKEMTTSSGSLDYKGWSEITKVYAGGTDNAKEKGGCLKFGTGSVKGSMTTGDILMTGTGTLTFWLKQYGSDTGKLNVTVTGAKPEATQFTPGSDWTLCTVNLTEATGHVTITLATSSKRAYVDEITLMGTPSGTPVDPTLAYYQSADGKKGAALKTSMCGIIYNRTEQSWNSLWNSFMTTDVRSDGKIWDMYSNITNYEPQGSGSTYSQEGDCYNREHSWPQSWFGSSVPMNTDLHHIYPTDGYVNGKRANYPFGETNGESYMSANGFSKLGACTYPGYEGKVFEPADEYKGDFARTYFYMVTCYEEKLNDWYTNYSSTEVTAVLDGNTYPGLQQWQLNMLMEWAENDPVSEKEINRNNAVYSIQNNRNPFIDYPGLEEYIWGSMTTTAFSYDNYVQPTHKQNVTITFNPTEATATIGEEFTEPTLTTDPANLTVTYSSNNADVATVDAGTGEVTLVAAGTAVITASYAGDDTYYANSASYTLTVSEATTPPEPIGGSGKYELITDASTLEAGDKILITYINGDDKYVLSTTQNSNNRAATDDVTLNTDGTLTPGAAAQIITLEKDADDNFNFNVGGGYLYAASSGSNYLRTEEIVDVNGNADAIIEIAENGNATITFQGPNKRNTLRFNPNTQNNNPLFSCYASNSTTGSLPQIYREMPPSYISGDANGDGVVTLADAVAIVNYILGDIPEGFNVVAADMNNDGKVTISDAVAVVNLLLSINE